MLDDNLAISKSIKKGNKKTAEPAKDKSMLESLQDVVNQQNEKRNKPAKFSELQLKNTGDVKGDKVYQKQKERNREKKAVEKQKSKEQKLEARQEAEQMGERIQRNVNREIEKARGITRKRKREDKTPRIRRRR